VHGARCNQHEPVAPRRAPRWSARQERGRQLRWPLSYFRRGSFIGICGALLTTIRLPSEDVWLMSVSRNRKNFSASIGVSSLVNVSPFFPMWIACNSIIKAHRLRRNVSVPVKQPLTRLYCCVWNRDGVRMWGFGGFEAGSRAPKRHRNLSRHRNGVCSTGDSCALLLQGPRRTGNVPAAPRAGAVRAGSFRRPRGFYQCGDEAPGQSSADSATRNPQVPS
jgi:hypothetical protein